MELADRPFAGPSIAPTVSSAATLNASPPRLPYVLAGIACLLLVCIVVLLTLLHRDVQAVGVKTENVELRLRDMRVVPGWEYRVEAISDLGFTAEINRLGAQGWEAVTARRASDGATYYPTYSYEIIFKRRVN